MLALDKILLPVDFSERSLAVAKHAALIAEQFRSQVILVYVRPPPPYVDAGLADLCASGGKMLPEAEVKARLRQRMDQFSEQTLPGRPVEKLVLEGDPADKVRELAEQREIALVMIPTRGYGTFRRMLLGSVTAKVLHDVSVPVFTGVHADGQAPYPSQRYERVACAIDLGPQSEAILRWASGFAQAWQAKLSVVHAAPFVEVLIDRAHFVTADWRAMTVRAAEQAIKNLLTKIGVKAKLRLDNGHPVHFVTAAAAEADCLIIGRGLAKGRSSRLPTHAYGIIRESPCAVISV